MYVLNIANKNYSSWSLRPWALMRERHIAFEERLHPFNPEGSSFEMFRAFSPNGMVPCLEDGAWKVWDSLGIAEYLAERHAGVWPKDAAARAWARCAAAEMHSGFPALREHCSMSVGVRVRLAETSPALTKDLARIDELWSEGLDRWGGPFLCGETFGAVDAFYAPVAFRVRGYGLALGETAAAYAERLLDLPSMREWEADALAEPWREPAHDAEIAARGAVIEDRRVDPAFATE
ncbi:glutathione S-transferase [Marinicauda salina]|uniref:Glutathione S-transferase n=1 Tax=Marinicauda salina TaxID=2135793 RepID=A0A2U2BR42_9PROT|nr:glutathione S-transferase family protein [Marinicauda salina]PWE16481.1 glutathione S-transferase [Marinicauda salina]